MDRQLIPLDNQLSRYYYRCEGVWDPTLGGYFPITEATNWTGQCDRTGSNSFKCIQIAYGSDANHHLLLIYTSYETRERLPDGTMLFTLDSCAWGAWQDPFGD